MYAAVPALLLNLGVGIVLTLILRPLDIAPGCDITDPEAYIG
jgi:hypothetical protein